MIVVIDGDAAPTARVTDGDACNKLHVDATGRSAADVRRAITEAKLGYVDDTDHVWLDVTALRALAEPEARSADWPERWQGMLGYAEKKSWLSADRKHVSAHVEY